MAPRKTELGDLAANKNNEVRIVIKNIGNATLTVSRIVSQKFRTVYFDGEQQGPIVIAASQQRTVTLVINPTQPGRFLDTILIFSDARNDIGKGYKGILAGEVK